MSRNLSAGMQAAVVATLVRPALLFEGTLADGSTVRYWTGLGDLSWNSQTWTGTGSLIGLGPIDETDDVKAQGVTVEINAIPSAMVSMILASFSNGNVGTIRLALLDSSNAVISTPKIIFTGKLDGAQINESDLKNPTATLTYEHALVDLERPREWRWTDETQKKFYSGDRGLEHIAALQDIQLPFGNKNRIGL